VPCRESAGVYVDIRIDPLRIDTHLEALNAGEYIRRCLSGRD